MSNAIRVKIKLASIFHFTGTSNEKRRVHKLSMTIKKADVQLKSLFFY